MDLEIVFSDVDGTLLNSEHKMLDGTKYAIQKLKEKDIPFVIISARSPSGIYPILEENGFSCPIICYSGALILDENKNTVYSSGFNREIAEKVISFIEKENFDCCWNLYSDDNWIVKNKSDERVITEENIVKTEAVSGSVESLSNDAKIGKILCICNPDKTDEIEDKIKKNFPDLSVVKSFHTMITIFNIIVSIIGALALGFVLSTLTTPDMKSMRRILRVCSIRKRVFVALAIFALVVLYQWLRV